MAGRHSKNITVPQQLAKIVIEPDLIMPIKSSVKARSVVGSNGKCVAHQIEIIANEGKYFQSYDTTIVFIDNTGQVWLDERKWDYSTTTAKWRNIFLGCNSKDLKARIKSGEYKFAELN